MSGLYYSLLHRCTFLFLAAAVLTLAAPFFIRRRQSLQTGICCFVVGWHLAAMDVVLGVISSFEMMGPEFHAEDAQFTVIYALLSLVIPLVSLAIIVLTRCAPTSAINRGNRQLYASCCIVLVDILLMVFVTASHAREMDGWITPEYREIQQQRSESQQTS